MTGSTGKASAQDLLAPLRERPGASAVLCDIDGTIAPIAPTAEEASVPGRARDLLRSLGRRYALVGCVSGRRAEDARRLVGVESIAYIGNHGLEYLAPGSEQAEEAPGLAGHESEARAFAVEAYTPELRKAGVRLEDKRSIQSFHWREAGDELAALNGLEQVARAASEQGLAPHWGRKVLEIRPPLAIDKGTALAGVLAGAGLEAALYAGDDTTDLDAFRALRALITDAALSHAICVGVRSEEGPAEIALDADIVVEGPEGVLELLELLAS